MGEQVSEQSPSLDDEIQSYSIPQCQGAGIGGHPQKQLEWLSSSAVVRMYRQVEEAANRIARAKGLELVLFYTDAVSEADFYNPTSLQRKLTQPGSLVPMIVAPGMDITQTVIDALNHLAAATGG